MSGLWQRVSQNAVLAGIASTVIGGTILAVLARPFSRRGAAVPPSPPTDLAVMVKQLEAVAPFQESAIRKSYVGQHVYLAGNLVTVKRKYLVFRLVIVSAHGVYAGFLVHGSTYPALAIMPKNHPIRVEGEVIGIEWPATLLWRVRLSFPEIGQS